MNVWLIQVNFTDDVTYGFNVTVAVCNNEIDAITAEEQAKKDYPTNTIYIVPVELNKYFG